MSDRSLDTADLVALSGAHTVGRAHCASFSDRLPPNVDDTIDPAFREKLTARCAKDPNATVTQVCWTCARPTPSTTSTTST